MMQKKAKVVKGVKIIVSILSFIYIAFLIQKQYFDFNEECAFFEATINYKYLVYCMLLLPINWGIEAFKWKLLIKPLYFLDFKKSVIAILSGVAVSLFTPNRMGEFVGRILVLPSKYRISGSIATFIGSLAQLMATIFFGIIALGYFLYKEIGIFDYLTSQHLLMLSLSLFVFIVVVYFSIKPAVNFLADRKIKLLKALTFLRNYTSIDIVNIIAFSFLRYLVFSFQFASLLYLFNVNISVGPILYGIALIYLLNTLMPSFALLEIGIRGSIAAFVFSLLSCDPIIAIAASTLLWVINLAFPALIGSLLWSRIKI